MNVRLTPAAAPTRTDVYSGVTKLEIDARIIRMTFKVGLVQHPALVYSKVEVDSDGADP